MYLFLERLVVLDAERSPVSFKDRLEDKLSSDKEKNHLNKKKYVK